MTSQYNSKCSELIIEKEINRKSGSMNNKSKYKQQSRATNGGSLYISLILKQQERKYQQMQSALVEKIDSARMQMVIIQQLIACRLNHDPFNTNQAPKIGNKHTDTNNDLEGWSDDDGSNLVSTAQSNKFVSSTHNALYLEQQQQNFNQLIQSIQNSHSYLSAQLCIKQIQIEKNSQNRQILTDYQGRIYDLGQILVTKENDIASDHLSPHNKPISAPRLRNFNNYWIQAGNIHMMGTKIKYFSNAIQSHCARNTLCEITNSSYNRSEIRKESECSPNKKQTENADQTKQMKAAYLNDPQFGKVMQKLKKQLIYRIKIQKQYWQLVAEYRQLCSQNQQLAALYRQVKI